ncbi:hypothetical protein Sango_0013400 [Sesamum angolense]|uniref:Transposase MuDR plant domain-containing protein n=1 Tax=Sesamum angolense TaxID=2727404 RepID=A0AAE1XCT5_9LAMI|nr:hypothetical protein Sango_0013400 [Sesamum angolense]
MASMPIIRPASLASEVPDYGKYDFLISVRIYHGGKKFVIEGDKEKNIETEGDKRKNTETEGDKGKNTENEGEPVHYNRDKGKGVVLEESGDGERADWIDWDRDGEDMRENEEWVADSEDDLYEGDESVDYNEDDECFDENVDKEAVWAAVKKGFLSGCRPFIGVDGCYLKGPHGGVLLTAVGVENRFCMRHLHGNMKTAGFKGLGYKKALWFAAKTTTVSHFQKAMQDIADLDVRCLEWLQDKPASQCCILEAREKPILTMLEWIREYVMTRMQQLRDRAERSWDSTGIPCNHAMSAISAQVLDHDDFVHKCYHVDTFCKVYAPAIMPLDGLEMWKKSGYIPFVPSSFGRKRGRPTRARRLEPDEVRNGKKPGKKIQKMPRQRGKMICRFCHQVGHNTIGCKWKKFAKEFPVDDVFEQAAETEQHEKHLYNKMR